MSEMDYCLCMGLVCFTQRLIADQIFSIFFFPVLQESQQGLFQGEDIGVYSHDSIKITCVFRELQFCNDGGMVY